MYVDRVEHFPGDKKRRARVDMSSVRSQILSQFRSVAKEQNKELPPLSDDLVLLDSELDSLCFAVIVARLEDELGIDPFSASEDIEFPVTLGDFVRIYEDVAR
jgi:acyl carrier protein